ncbi:MAG TPA: hypothetical protein VK968_19200 [Roseimicrobium sp.]|nr:hypothetical protein [Roseimicrobium sp.]
MRDSTIPRVLIALLLLLPSLLQAQIDPSQRQLIQTGYNQPLEGKGPISGYAYYYLNQPGFLRTNLTLRLAIAPVYIDGELGVSQALGDRTDLGFGISGGGFADSFSEVRGGKYIQEESFTGHGGGVSVSLYHRFNPDAQIPLYGIARVSLHNSIYERDSRTRATFVLPDDQNTFHVRAGFRFGGREPVLSPDVAMELSAWYDGQWRSNPGAYGFAGDRKIEPYTHQFWGRSLFIYTLPESKHSFSVNMTAGFSMNPDRFSTYRLGAVLPMASEFPLNLPGYYFQEISARRFVLFGGEYYLPLDSERRWHLFLGANTAVVDYLDGMQQPGPWHSGLNGGIGYKNSTETFNIILGYAYGVDARRSHGKGASSIGLLCQFDLGTFKRNRATAPTPDIPQGSRGLFRIFN